jgi:hypothetical protein
MTSCDTADLQAGPDDPVILKHELQWCSFDGDPDGPGPLTWAQQHLWRLVNLPGNYDTMDVPVGVLVREPIGVRSAKSCISLLASGNPALRTRIRTDRRGHPVQEVTGRGTIPVHVVEMAAPVPAARIWPQLPPARPHLVQALIGIVSGYVRIVALRLNHVLTDGWGAMVLAQQLDAALAMAGSGKPRRPAAPEQMSPLGMAEFERSERGQLTGRRALRYAAAELSTAPPTMFPHEPLTWHQHRYWDVTMRSAPLRAALDAISGQRHIPVSVPVVAAFATIMATRAALPAALIYVTANNRITRDRRTFAGPMAQDIPLFVPFPTSGLRALLGALAPRLLRAYQRGHHDPAALDRCMTRIEARRGIRFDRPPWAAMINVQTGSPADPAGPGAGFQTQPRAEIQSCAFVLEVIITDAEAILFAHVDASIVSLDETRAIMTGIDVLVRRLNKHDVRPDDIAALCPGISRPLPAGTRSLNGGLICLPDCRNLMESVSGVHEAEIYLDRAGKALTASLHADDGVQDDRSLHERVVSMLPLHSRATAPDVYRIYRACPDRRTGSWRWDDHALAVVGTGRPEELSW